MNFIGLYVLYHCVLLQRLKYRSLQHAARNFHVDNVLLIKLSMAPSYGKMGIGLRLLCHFQLPEHQQVFSDIAYRIDGHMGQALYIFSIHNFDYTDHTIGAQTDYSLCKY